MKNHDFDLFRTGCLMINEHQVIKLKTTVFQTLMYWATDSTPVTLKGKAGKRFKEKIDFATKLSLTFNESIDKLREQMDDRQREDFLGI